MFGASEYPADDIDLLTGVDVTKPDTLTEVLNGLPSLRSPSWRAQAADFNLQALAGAGAVVFASSASQKASMAFACRLV